jgi:hypothetical protein
MLKEDWSVVMCFVLFYFWKVLNSLKTMVRQDRDPRLAVSLHMSCSKLRVATVKWQRSDVNCAIWSATRFLRFTPHPFSLFTHSTCHIFWQVDVLSVILSKCNAIRCSVDPGRFELVKRRWWEICRTNKTGTYVPVCIFRIAGRVDRVIIHRATRPATPYL